MEVLYIPQLDGDDADESPTAGRYRLLKRVPEGAWSPSPPTDGDLPRSSAI